MRENQSLLKEKEEELKRILEREHQFDDENQKIQV